MRSTSAGASVARPPAPGHILAPYYGTVEPQTYHIQISRRAMIPYICEFVGTFALVFFTGCCSVAAERAWAATAVGGVYIALLYSMAPICEVPSSFNPAISLALALAGKLRGVMALGFVMVQLIAGLLAGLAYTALFKKSVIVGPRVPYHGFDCGCIELLYSVVVCFVFLNCVVAKQNSLPEVDRNQFFGLAVGFAYIAGGYAAEGVSGGMLNPAVALGLDLTGYDASHFYGLQYSMCQILGSVFAVLLFRSCRHEERTGGPSFEDILRFGYKPKLDARIMGEFFGTFVVAFTFGINLVTKQTAAAWSTAAALTCMIYSLGNACGAHFNPAISLAVIISGRCLIRPIEACLYIIIQLSAGILAGLAVGGFQSRGPFVHDTTFGAVPRSNDYTWAACIWIELLFTALVVFVFLSVSTAAPVRSGTRHNNYFALAIGSAAMGGGIAFAHVSGGVFNPAIALAVSSATVVSMPKPPPFSDCAMLGLAELLGGILAAALFGLLRPEEFGPRPKADRLRDTTEGFVKRVPSADRLAP